MTAPTLEGDVDRRPEPPTGNGSGPADELDPTMLRPGRVRGATQTGPSGWVTAALVIPTVLFFAVAAVIALRPAEVSGVSCGSVLRAPAGQITPLQCDSIINTRSTIAATLAGAGLLSAMALTARSVRNSRD